MGAALTGLVMIQGWAFDNDSIARVDILLDGNLIGLATYGISRPDISRNVPGAPVNCNCGVQFPLDSTQFPGGAHVIAMRAVDPTGNATTIQHSVTFAN